MRTGIVEVRRALMAPDKFRGTATARQASEAMGRGASSLGWAAQQLPLADGGEGLLDALSSLGGVRRTVDVEGPLGGTVSADWLQIGRLAVVEMAQASGLLLAGGSAGNDPLGASTRGTGQLILAAAEAVAAAGAGDGDGPTTGSSGPPGTVVVGLGGSATTDGGWGALAAIEEAGGLGGVELVGACDVDVGFVEAAPRFGPQKGADPDQVVELEARLEDLARRYRSRYGIDVRAVPRTGAAGGLGARSVSSVAGSGRATGWSPSWWGSTRPWRPARSWSPVRGPSTPPHCWARWSARCCATVPRPGCRWWWWPARWPPTHWARRRRRGPPWCR